MKPESAPAEAATSSRNAARAFTLIELLVVIGIIALLISILLPALNRAREEGAAIKCGSNMRQIYMYMLMYVNDNKNFLPAVPAKQCSFGSTTFPMAWWMSSSGMMDVTHGGSMLPYFPSSADGILQIFNCPDDQAQGDLRPVSTNGIGPRNFTYSFDAYIDYAKTPTFNGYDNTFTAFHPTINVGSIHNFSQKLFIIEEKWPNDSSCQLVGCSPGGSPAGPDTDDIPGTRHNGYGNFVFGDGHVERLLPSDIYSNCTQTGSATINVSATTAQDVDWFNWLIN